MPALNAQLYTVRNFLHPSTDVAESPKLSYAFLKTFGLE